MKHHKLYSHCHCLINDIGKNFFPSLYTRPMFKFILDSDKQNLIGAELGVGIGSNAKNILKRLSVKMLYLVDPYIDYVKDFETARHKLYPFEPNTTFIKKKSQNASNDIPNNLDFVYIDGEHHTSKSILKDIALYYPKIKDGGVLGGHDFDIPDVAQAVTEFANDKNQKVFTFGYPVDWWIVLNRNLYI